MRRPLPARRRNATFKVHHQPAAGGGFKLLVTVGFYDDGTPGEIFINTEMRAGNEADTLMSDAAVVTSLALQYGCPLAVLREAMKRNPDGSPMGVFSHILDQVEAACGPR